MDVFEAITGRASIRAFLKKPVPRELIHKILDVSRWAPSGVNVQPWHVAVATGAVKVRIGRAIVEAIESGQKHNPDYQYYCDKFWEPYRTRRFQCGLALYGALGIDRKDVEKRKEQWMKNYDGFGAPVELFVFIDKDFAKGSWTDMGMFIQNIMLAARGCGLETCPQASMAEYPDIVRGLLEIPENLSLICGIAVGYADKADPVNNYRTERDSVDSFTQWHGFEDASGGN